MRIVQIGTDVLPVPPKYGGAYETYIYGVSKTLVAMGFEVHIIALDEKEREYVKEGIMYHTFRLNSPWAKSISILLKLIDEPNKNVPYITHKISSILKLITDAYGEIDIIHVHLPATSLAPLVFKSLYKSRTKLVMHWHNEPRYGIIRKIMHKSLMLRYNIHCAVSRYIKRKLLTYIRDLYGRISVVYNAVDTEFFVYREQYRNKMREQLGLPNDGYVILFIGRIIPEKGLHHIIKIMPQLIRRFKDLKLVIVGPKGHYEKEDSSYFRYVNNLIKTYNLEKHVLYLGRVKREYLPWVYSMADVIAVPSLWQDPCPTVVLEAMSCGRPVVAYNVGGIPEIIKNNVTGFIVEKGNINMLKIALEKCLRNRSRWNATVIRSHVEKQFSYRAVCCKLKRLYEALIE